LTIMLVCAIGSMLGRSNMLMLVFALMAGPFILNGWIVFSMLKRTQVTRRVPSLSMAGEPISVEVSLKNRKWLLSSRVMSVRDRIEHDRETLEGRVLFVRVPPRSERKARYQMRLMRRGRYQVGPALLSSRFPLGLVERGLFFYKTDEILVSPQLGQLKPSWKQEQAVFTEPLKNRPFQRGSFQEEFHGIREYRLGDNPRTIHWRTSARRNELMVREFHHNRDPNLRILCDLWEPKHPDEEQQDRSELALSFAATICVEHLRQTHGASIVFTAAGKELVHWEGPSSAGGAEELMRSLAVIGPAIDPPVDRMLEDSYQNSRLDAWTILITTRPQGSEEFRSLEEKLAQRTDAGASDHIHIIEADEARLSQVFMLG